MGFRVFALAALTLVSGSCGRSPEPVGPGGPLQRVQVGDTVRLQFSGSAQIGESVRITFRAVAEDSRCPINVVCVWAGDAAVTIDAALPGSETKPLTLHTNLEPKAGAFAGFVIELIEVAPARVDPDTLKPSDYSVRLAISRG